MLQIQRMGRLSVIAIVGAMVALCILTVLLFSASARYAYRNGGARPDTEALGGWRDLTTDYFTLRHPAAWQARAEGTGAALWPGAASAAEDAGLWVAVGDEVLAEWPDTLLAQGEAVQHAENVAIGGLSGSETIYELPPEGRAALGVLNEAAQHVWRGEGSEPLTLIVWHADAPAPHQVIMFDLSGGQHLSMLERIRDTIEWRGMP